MTAPTAQSAQSAQHIGTAPTAPASRPKDLRLPALRRFAFAITLLNVLGHFWLGFEQSWAAPLVALATTYSLELGLEAVAAWQQRRRPRFLTGGPVGLIDFLLSAHISGLAVSMLLYSADRLWPVAFGAAVAIGSKYVFRVTLPGGGGRHFFNPSNLGITVTLLAFPSVGLAQPYMFTENLNPFGGWLLPAVLVAAGTFLNGRFTRKLPLVAGWVGGFALQALGRWGLTGNLPLGELLPMTGVALLLFTFYMVTDPATTPGPPRRQFAFGLSVAALYGLLLAAHVVFTPFIALTLVSAGRGVALWLAARRQVAAAAATARQPALAAAGAGAGAGALAGAAGAVTAAGMAAGAGTGALGGSGAGAGAGAAMPVPARVPAVAAVAAAPPPDSAVIVASGDLASG
jgi:enediyne biosynthesis protein E5